MSNYYLGTSPADVLGNDPRYFYALRKNADGSLFFTKNDQLIENEVLEINLSGNVEENYNDFESGVDFFEGINVNHEIMFKNLKYPQYRWDNRSILYFIDEEGQLVARINRGYNYQDGLSED
jgi:hypothetical protein